MGLVMKQKLQVTIHPNAPIPTCYILCLQICQNKKILLKIRKYIQLNGGGSDKPKHIVFKAVTRK